MLLIYQESLGDTLSTKCKILSRVLQTGYSLRSMQGEPLSHRGHGPCPLERPIG